MKIQYLAIFVSAAIVSLVVLGTYIIANPILVGSSVLYGKQENKVYSYVIHEPYSGVDKPFGTVIIQNQTFHVAAPNPALRNSTRPFTIEMYDVEFTFPNGYGPTTFPDGQTYQALVTFPNDPTKYRLDAPIPMIPVRPYNFTTVLTNHTNPQAGFTVHGGKIQLLVNWPKIHDELSITGLNDTYVLEQPIDFQIRVSGFDYFDAGETPDINITRVDGKVVWQEPPQLVLCCPSDLTDYNGTFNLVSLGGPVILNETGLYRVEARYNHQTVEKDFTVSYSGPKNTSYSHRDTISVMINRNYTGFSLNYTITDGPYNKVLGAQMYEKDKSLWLALVTKRNGMLTIDIPRALLDAQIHNQDTQFIILTDGYQVFYNETSSISERSLTIPFKAGITTMEITVPQLV